MKTLSFPLYHGTSTLFSDSIKENGLGEINTLEVLKALNFLTQLEKIAKETLRHVVDWKYIEDEISSITSQRNGFQHGQVYLSPSRDTAGRYSQKEYGSELISCVFEVVNLLRKNNIQIPNELLTQFGSIMLLENIEKRSIVYQVMNLPVDYLLMGERGEEVNIQIDKVNQWIEKKGFDRYQNSPADQINFRLAKPIPFDFLIICNE